MAGRRCRLIVFQRSLGDVTAEPVLATERGDSLPNLVIPITLGDSGLFVGFLRDEFCAHENVANHFHLHLLK